MGINGKGYPSVGINGDGCLFDIINWEGYPMRPLVPTGRVACTSLSFYGEGCPSGGYNGGGFPWTRRHQQGGVSVRRYKGGTLFV